jgi:hypothetical protein
VNLLVNPRLDREYKEYVHKQTRLDLVPLDQLNWTGNHANKLLRKEGDNMKNVVESFHNKTGVHAYKESRTSAEVGVNDQERGPNAIAADILEEYDE